MNYIVIASHGRLASGMEDTVRFFNHSANIISLNAYSDDCHNFAEELAIILDDHRNDNVVIFTDIIGGSVTQIAYRYLKEYNFILIAQMNLPLILEATLYEGEIDFKWINERICNKKYNAILLNTVELAKEDEEDEVL